LVIEKPAEKCQRELGIQAEFTLELTKIYEKG